MARNYQTRNWHDLLSPSLGELEMMAIEAYAHLPEDFRTLTGEVIIQVAEFPEDEIMDALVQLDRPRTSPPRDAPMSGLARRRLSARAGAG